MTQEEEYSFLKIFCADPEGYRPTLSKPFLQDGHVIATDTTILIKIREDLLSGKYEENEKAPDVSKVWPEKFLPVLTITRDELFEALQNAKVETDYRGHIPLNTHCPECKGEGEVHWNYSDRNGKCHLLLHDCPICEGEGYSSNGTNVAIGIYGESFKANPLIKVLYAMKALEVDYVTYSPSGDRAAQFNLKEGIDIIIMPQSHIKPNSWIKKKGKRR